MDGISDETLELLKAGTLPCCGGTYLWHETDTDGRYGHVGTLYVVHTLFCVHGEG